MGKNNNEISAVNRDIDQIIEQKPYIAAMLDAFRPIILEKNRLLREMADSRTTLAVDEVKYRGGIPLIRQCRLFFPEDPWQEMALAVTGAIRTGFPHLAGDMERLAEQLKGGLVDPYDYFRSSADPDENQIKAWAEKIPIDPGALRFFISIMARIILTKRAREAAAAIAPLPWDKGYCPVCGSFPMLAVTREKGQKWLQCSQCSHEWLFPRLRCPSCDHENPQETNYQYVDNEKNEQAFTCGKCRKYLITINRPANLEKSDLDITAISLAHLDLLLQNQGFTPMAVCAWNTF
ncbi:MAG: formate dehydrogenase accessory protein FdhE [Desulfobulbaceae bacterium]|nr:formate dehydrogenase accessory protein FdhE [Desulfobulbaceae bacterium]